MFSRLKTEVLTDEEKERELEGRPEYAVRFTNKNNGKVLYVGVSRVPVYDDEVIFVLYGSDGKLIERSYVEVRSNLDYFSKAKLFRKAASQVEGDARKLYKKAAQAAAAVAEKREELEEKRQKAAEKLRKEQGPTFKAIRDLFGR